MPRISINERKDAEKHPNQTQADKAQQRNEQERAVSRRDTFRTKPHPERKET